MAPAPEGSGNTHALPTPPQLHIDPRPAVGTEPSAALRMPTSDAQATRAWLSHAAEGTPCQEDTVVLTQPSRPAGVHQQHQEVQSCSSGATPRGAGGFEDSLEPSAFDTDGSLGQLPDWHSWISEWEPLPELGLQLPASFLGLDALDTPRAFGGSPGAAASLQCLQAPEALPSGYPLGTGDVGVEVQMLVEVPGLAPAAQGALERVFAGASGAGTKIAACTGEVPGYPTTTAAAVPVGSKIFRQASVCDSSGGAGCPRLSAAPLPSQRAAAYVQNPPPALRAAAADGKRGSEPMRVTKGVLKLGGHAQAEVAHAPCANAGGWQRGGAAGLGLQRPSPLGRLDSTTSVCQGVCAAEIVRGPAALPSGAATAAAPSPAAVLHPVPPLPSPPTSSAYAAPAACSDAPAPISRSLTPPRPSGGSPAPPEEGPCPLVNRLVTSGGSVSSSNNALVAAATAATAAAAATPAAAAGSGSAGVGPAAVGAGSYNQQLLGSCLSLIQQLGANQGSQTLQPSQGPQCSTTTQLVTPRVAVAASSAPAAGGVGSLGLPPGTMLPLSALTDLCASFAAAQQQQQQQGGGGQADAAGTGSRATAKGAGGAASRRRQTPRMPRKRTWSQANSPTPSGTRSADGGAPAGGSTGAPVAVKPGAAQAAGGGAASSAAGGGGGGGGGGGSIAWGCAAEQAEKAQADGGLRGCSSHGSDDTVACLLSFESSVEELLASDASGGYASFKAFGQGAGPSAGAGAGAGADLDVVGSFIALLQDTEGGSSDDANGLRRVGRADPLRRPLRTGGIPRGGPNSFGAHGVRGGFGSIAANVAAEAIAISVKTCLDGVAEVFESMQGL